MNNLLSWSPFMVVSAGARFAHEHKMVSKGTCLNALIALTITVSIGNLSMLEARRAPLAASMAAMPLMSSLSGTALTVNHMSPEAGNARGFATL